MAGWSWIVEKAELDQGYLWAYTHLDLPIMLRHLIQHQIIDGVELSKMSLFEITGDLDHGPVLMKMTYLEGGDAYDI